MRPFQHPQICPDFCLCREVCQQTARVLGQLKGYLVSTTVISGCDCMGLLLSQPLTTCYWLCHYSTSCTNSNPQSEKDRVKEKQHNNKSRWEETWWKLKERRDRKWLIPSPADEREFLILPSPAYDLQCLTMDFTGLTNKVLLPQNIDIQQSCEGKILAKCLEMAEMLTNTLDILIGFTKIS